MPRQAGAVSIVMIIFVILTLIFASTTYWLYTESEDAKARLAESTAQNQEKDTKLQTQYAEVDRLGKQVTNLANDVTKLKERAESAERQRETVKGLNDNLKRETESLHSQHRKQLESKQKFIDELRNERDDLKNKIASLEAQLRDNTDNFSKKIEKLEEEKQEVVKLNRENMSERNSRVRNLEDRIKQLLGIRAKQLESVEPDGNVLSANNDKRLVVIDLGQRENVKAGLKFEVFQIRGGGKYTAKGMIEVKEVQDTISICYIISLDSDSDPIIPGDLVGSPIYDKEDHKKFYVAGDFEKYEAEAIKRLIGESGGIVVDQIDLYTDFVVLGIRNSGVAKSEAIEIGVKMMSEQQLLKYLMD